MINKNNTNFDYIIIGAGIIGLSVARNLIKSNPNLKIAIFEKENKIGLHASGRNSGVLHSGIYYKENSLKARVCIEGSRLMKEYCDEFQLPISQTGKVIVPTKESDESTLHLLYQRALNNGAKIQLITKSELYDIEPDAHTATDHALFAPETSVIDSKAILEHLFKELEKNKVRFFFNNLCSEIDTKQKLIKTQHNSFSYGHLFNTSGLYADKIALACGLVDRYTIVPFKGIYYELNAQSPTKLNHLIYPVPDMNMPFLGIHFTKSITGKIYVGPTAFPALGRENYQGIRGIKFSELASTFNLFEQAISLKQTRLSKLCSSRNPPCH